MGEHHLQELSALLTADCNLHCAYCYQDARQPGAMEWSSLRTAIDRLFDLPADRPMLSFAGGEATLHWELLRRAVRYAETKRQADKALAFHLVTNGLLIGSRELRFLASNDFALELSCDGVPGAQDLRGPGSFLRLDRLLDDLASRHADYFARRVSVSMTVARRTIPHLSASLEYFIRKDVASVTCRPAMGQEEWGQANLALLDRELATIVDLLTAHHDNTGRIPLTNFRTRRWRPASARPSPGAWNCSAPLGQALVVDVDGQVYPCAVFARSYQAFERWMDERVRRLSLGDVRDSQFPARLAHLEEACRQSELFAPKRLQRSGKRRCATCRERAECVVCPLARMKRPGGPLLSRPTSAGGAQSLDLNDIPRYLCAWERTLGRHRRRFLARVPAPRGEQLLQRLLAERRLGRTHS